MQVERYGEELHRKVLEGIKELPEVDPLAEILAAFERPEVTAVHIHRPPGEEVAVVKRSGRSARAEKKRKAKRKQARESRRINR